MICPDKVRQFYCRVPQVLKSAPLLQSGTGVPLNMPIIVELCVLHHSKYAILFLKFYGVAKCPSAGHGLKYTKSPTVRTDYWAFNLFDFSNFLRATRVVSCAIVTSVNVEQGCS